ncbi:MAG: DUF2905 domain-containing protein [Hydrogenothermaceae bacterium]|nr:DUF2905 domain-containing protein [Hydrogenothermaceae bacterium]
MESIGKLILFVGLIMVTVGLMLILLEKLPFSIGKLLGDIIIKKDKFTFYFPIVTSILISLVISLILLIVSKVMR